MAIAFLLFRDRLGCRHMYYMFTEVEDCSCHCVSHDKRDRYGGFGIQDYPRFKSAGAKELSGIVRTLHGIGRHQPYAGYRSAKIFEDLRRRVIDNSSIPHDRSPNAAAVGPEPFFYAMTGQQFNDCVLSFGRRCRINS